MKTASRRGTRRANARTAVKTAPLRNPSEVDEPMVTAPPRPEHRAPMREDDPRARAAARAAQLRDHGGSLEEGQDKFYVAPDVVPDGWCYEWKRRTVYGKEDPSYQVQLARTGWEPVPASRHPEYMPSGWDGGVIERDGMVLMERPQEITDEARAIERRNASDQMRHKEEQLSATPQGQLPRDADPRTKLSLKKSYEPMVVPEG